MAHIDYYFTPLSPFTYLAEGQLEEIAEKYGATITYKPIDIISLFPRTGGIAQKDRHPSRLEYRAQDLLRKAKKRNLPFHLKPAHWPTNAAPASYAIISAQKAGNGDLAGFVQSLFRAVWVEEKDIAQDEVIADCLTAAGFDAGLATSGLLSGAETYAANLEEAVSAGVFGAPFYIVDGTERFWGEDRLEDLNLFLAGELS